MAEQRQSKRSLSAEGAGVSGEDSVGKVTPMEDCVAQLLSHKRVRDASPPPAQQPHAPLSAHPISGHAAGSLLLSLPLDLATYVLVACDAATLARVDCTGCAMRRGDPTVAFAAGVHGPQQPGGSPHQVATAMATASGVGGVHNKVRERPRICGMQTHAKLRREEKQPPLGVMLAIRPRRRRRETLYEYSVS